MTHLKKNVNQISVNSQDSLDYWERKARIFLEIRAFCISKGARRIDLLERRKSYGLVAESGALAAESGALAAEPGTLAAEPRVRALNRHVKVTDYLIKAMDIFPQTNE